MEPIPPAARESVFTEYRPPQPDRDRIGLHVGLFLATFACMVFVAGFGFWQEIDGRLFFSSLVGREAYYQAAGWTSRLADGLLYAAPFLLFLTVHEFGHYLAARWHGVRVSLPYYIPLPFALGTFGAVIRIREPIQRTRQLFDIGASGPLAGFVIALGVLLVAVLTLPPVEYLLSVDPAGMNIHALTVEQYRQTGAFPSAGLVAGGGSMVFGTTPLFSAAMAIAEYPVPGYEIMHYPILLAGWLGLFFTALNLLPVGQLDGGHVIYALFGPAVHRVVARVATLVLLVSGCVGWINQMVPQMTQAFGPNGLIGSWAVLALLMLVYLRRFFGDVRAALVGVPVLLALAFAVVYLAPGLAFAVGYWGWLLWVGLILYIIGVDHPPVLVREPLSPGRVALGWACIAIFLLCFSIQPIVVG